MVLIRALAKDQIKVLIMVLLIVVIIAVIIIAVIIQLVMLQMKKILFLL